MSLESALRELGKEIQKDERFAALQAAAKANDGDEKLQQQMQELQLIKECNLPGGISQSNIYKVVVIIFSYFIGKFHFCLF